MIRKKSFSLIELLVVIAIISIMTIVMLVFLGNNKKNKELEAAAREVTAALREAQNYALTGKQVTANEYPCYFRVAKSSNTTYSIIYRDHILSDSCINSTDDPNPYVTYSLKNNIEIEDSPTTFYFDVPFGDVCTAGPPCTSLGLGSYITIKLHKIGSSTSVLSNYYAVCVTPNGNIYENANSKSCP